MRVVRQHPVIASVVGTLVLVGVIVGGYAAHAATTATASCTANPVVTDTSNGSRITVVCTVPKPPVVTVTATATQTVTVSATPTPAASDTPTPSPSDPPASAPSPSDTVAPTPTPATSPTAAFPDASNTGVPAGTVLKPSGSVTVTTPGAVIDGLDISGALVIKANNVTVKNTRVMSGSDFWVVTNQATGTKFDHVTVAGKGLSSTVTGQSGIVGDQFTATAVDVSGVENGFVPGNGSVIQNSYVHDLNATGAAHYDGIQIDGNVSNVRITGNTIANNHTQTSAVMVDNGDGAVTGVVVDGNQLVGGGYTVYADGQFNTSKVDVAYTNNAIGKGYYGYALTRGSGLALTWSGNTDAVTGKPIN